MSLEIIVFIASILFGIVLYWRESKSNKVYRFFNKIFYSKELQMSDSSAKGFLYQQSFLMRLVYIGVLFLVGIVVVRFIIPIDLATLSLFASSIFGTLLGTYLEKGKDFIQDLESKDAKVETEVKQEMNSKPEAEKQSARDRLKDKGLM